MFCALVAALSLSAQPLSLSLGQCRELALSHSEDMKIQTNRAHQAEEDTRIAYTSSLPVIEGTATGAYVLPDIDAMGMDLRMRGMYMAGVTLTQPIYAGGKLATARKLALIGEEAASETIRKTRMDVISDADNAYWTYISVRGKVRMLQAYCAMMDTLYTQISAAVSVGMATENDLLRVDAERSNINYSYQKAANGADLCRMSLCNVIGSSYDTEIEPVDSLTQVHELALMGSDASERPEIKLLGKQIEASEQQVRMAKGDMLPSVGLTVGYTYYGNIKVLGNTQLPDGSVMPFKQGIHDGMGVAMLGVKIPIFDCGVHRQKVRKARYDVQNAQLELQKNSRLIEIQVQQAIKNLQDGFHMTQTSELATAQAEENLRVTRNRYHEQVAPLSDLLDAQTSWQQARSNQLEAGAQYMIYYTEYLRAIGKLCE